MRGFVREEASYDDSTNVKYIEKITSQCLIIISTIVS